MRLPPFPPRFQSAINWLCGICLQHTLPTVIPWLIVMAHTPIRLMTLVAIEDRNLELTHQSACGRLHAATCLPQPCPHTRAWLASLWWRSPKSISYRPCQRRPVGLHAPPVPVQKLQPGLHIATRPAPCKKRLEGGRLQQTVTQGETRQIADRMPARCAQEPGNLDRMQQPGSRYHRALVAAMSILCRSLPAKSAHRLRNHMLVRISPDIVLHAQSTGINPLHAPKLTACLKPWQYACQKRGGLTSPSPLRRIQRGEGASPLPLHPIPNSFSPSLKTCSANIMIFPGQTERSRAYSEKSRARFQGLS